MVQKIIKITQSKIWIDKLKINNYQHSTKKLYELCVCERVCC